MTQGINLLTKLLAEGLTTLDFAVAQLKLSFRKCTPIAIKEEMDNEELEAFDSLSSRFARVYEMYVKQLLRTVLRIIGEYEDTFLDNANKATKLDLIEGTDLLEECRKLRNRFSCLFAL